MGGVTSRLRPGATVAAGGFFVCMGGIHVGLVSADPEVYGGFADRALFGFVERGWSDVFMAAPAVWGLLLAGFEIAVGAALLSGGLPARAGWVLASAFQVLLMLFGWGLWLWSVPAVTLFVLGARRDWAALCGRARETRDGRPPAGEDARRGAGQSVRASR